ncbi:hypothetical protein EIP86_000575 [Pleurotus ostreatoroseus]|nr:hypothetical protein EIP86_000575 [Pleurotus ostreatoroseus]
MATTSTGIMELPAEITDSIIDCLYDDRQTLKSCALTHPTWLDRSRYHLHHSVNIDGSADTDKLIGYYETGAAAYIQNLTLIAPPESYSVHRGGHMSLRAQSVWRTASRFTNITSLNMTFFNWRGQHKSYDRIAHIARHVTHLNLVLSTFRDVADFLSFLSVFPALEALTLGTLTFSCASSWGAGYSPHSDDELLQHLATPAGQALRSVSFSNTHPCPQMAEQLGKWLGRLPAQVVPRSSLTWTGAGSIQGLIHALRGLGGNLAHLELDTVSAERLAYEGDNVLRSNTAVETLVFRDLQYIARDEVQWLLVLLSQLVPAALRKVVFVCTASCFEGVDEHSLELLDEFLSAPVFSALEEVAIQFGHTSHQKEIDGMVKRGLQRLDKRNALKPVFLA